MIITKKERSKEFKINYKKLIEKKYERKGEKQLRPVQENLSKFFDRLNPQRGLLIYHGLGAGKSCTAVSIANNFEESRDIVFLLPAKSLESNIKEEILTCGSKNLMNKSSFHVYSGLTDRKAKEWKESKYLDNKLIIIDESHNFTSLIVNYIASNREKGVRGRFLLDLFENAKNVKIIMLSATPYRNFPLEIAVTFNILAGQNVKYEINIDRQILNRLSQEMIHDKLTKFKEIYNLKFRGNKMSYYITPFGFIADEGIIKSSPNTSKTYEEFHNNLMFHLKELQINERNINGPHLETSDWFNVDTFDENFVNENGSLINSDIISERILGLVSEFNTKTDENIIHEGNKKIVLRDDFPDAIYHPIDFIEMSEFQYRRYERVRIQEIKEDLKKSIRSGFSPNASDDLTTFKARSHAICKLAFPNEVYDEKNIEDDSIRQEIFKNILKSTSATLDTIGLYSEKYKKLIERVNSITDGTAVVYSKQKVREGLDSLITILGHLGFSRYEIKKKGNNWIVPKNTENSFVMYNGSAEDEIYRKIFNSEFNTIEEDFMINIEGFKKITVKNLNNGVEKLKEKGFNISKEDIIKCLDGEKKSMKRNDIKISFEYVMEKPLKTLLKGNNYNGEKIKLFFISVAGSEGITLKNSRQIHVLEHYWNSVRTNQVIGRAIRYKSHDSLPIEKRNVAVYQYVSVIPKKLQNNDFLRKYDSNLSSDEVVLQVSQKKEKLSNQFLDILRKSAIDCSENCYETKPNYEFYINFEEHFRNHQLLKRSTMIKFRVPDKRWIPRQFRGQFFYKNESSDTFYDKQKNKIGKINLKTKTFDIL